MRNYTVESGVCKFLLVFHCNYARNLAWSFKVIENGQFDRSCTASYLSAIASTTSSYLTLNNIVTLQSPCEFMHDLYIAEIHRPRTTFTPLIAGIYLHSFLHCELNRKLYREWWCVAVVQGHSRLQK